MTVPGRAFAIDVSNRWPGANQCSTNIECHCLNGFQEAHHLTTTLPSCCLIGTSSMRFGLHVCFALTVTLSGFGLFVAPGTCLGDLASTNGLIKTIVVLGDSLAAGY